MFPILTTSDLGFRKTSVENRAFEVISTPSRPTSTGGSAPAVGLKGLANLPITSRLASSVPGDSRNSNYSRGAPMCQEDVMQEAGAIFDAHGGAWVLPKSRARTPSAKSDMPGGMRPGIRDMRQGRALALYFAASNAKRAAPKAPHRSGFSVTSSVSPSFASSCCTTPRLRATPPVIM